MDARVFTEPQQGASYDTLLAAALATESAGFDAFFRSDHVLKMGSVDGLPGPTDAWITLAGLARETERIRLGTLVSPGTFRYPGLLAIEVAQVSDMSGGRVELGLGAGWYEAEHTAYGLPFGTLGERFERLEEQLAIVTGLWDTPADETFSFSGRYYQLTDSPALPKPPSRPRVIVGGRGKRRTPRLAAAYADEFNQGFVDVGRFATQRDRVAAACEAAGREPGSLLQSVALVGVLGADEATLSRRAAAIGREVGELRENGLCVSAAEVLDKLAVYADAGAERLYVQILDLDDLDHIAEWGADVLPHLPNG
jgi:F420-dependent oxidoreductase-like protein